MIDAPLAPQLDMFGAQPRLAVRLGRDGDIDRPCCDNIALIEPGHGPHAGSLRCTGCGKHRGWVAAAALEAIAAAGDAITKTFGPTDALPVLRTPTPKEKVMMRKFDDRNRGAIWKNEDKSDDNQPDFKGSLNVDGVDFWVSAWKRKEGAPATAPSLKFSIKRKERDDRRLHADVPLKTKDNSESNEGGSARGQSDTFFSDSIPFAPEWRG
jgi:hypothetical protein